MRGAWLDDGPGSAETLELLADIERLALKSPARRATASTTKEPGEGRARRASGGMSGGRQRDAQRGGKKHWREDWKSGALDKKDDGWEFGKWEETPQERGAVAAAGAGRRQQRLRDRDHSCGRAPLMTRPFGTLRSAPSQRPKVNILGL